MMTQMQRMDIISNNLANADTVGYKRDHVVSHSFSTEMARRLNDPGIRMFRENNIGGISPGVFVDDVFTDFSQGVMRQTGGSLDFAISGGGFFVVDRAGEELYTRDGSFTIFNGMLLTSDGARVQGLNGNITLPHGEIDVDVNGRIFVAGEYIDTLRMVQFTDLHTLRKLEDNLLRTTEDSEMTAFDGQILQGFLEGSNVNSVSEMVHMITISRAYESNARMISMQDETLQRAVNDIARR
jgi:flagellar basal-body rod protein FlgG